MAFSQIPTVGLTQYTDQASDEYTFFCPFTSDCYLLDRCGHLVNKWERESIPGLSARLLDNGLMLRTVKPLDGVSFGQASTGGIIELVDWNNKTVGSYKISDENIIQHHDAIMLPNGNFMLLVWEKFSEEELIMYGAETNTLWSELIYEIELINETEYEIVWEWNLKNHLIQDNFIEFDNYAVIKDNIGKVDINYSGPYSFGDPHRWHCNAIDYNAALDQILFNSRNNSEVWIIDHSTTTEEAAGDFGGVSGKGGQLLYRWGNPEAYDCGEESDLKMKGSHGTYWIPEGLPNEGKIMFFNNGNGSPTGPYSTIEMIDPIELDSGRYELNKNQVYFPLGSEKVYEAEFSWTFYSTYLSNAQQLGNGNVFINEGENSRFFEVNPDDNSIVWEYESPIIGQTFRAYKYDADFSGFDGQDINGTQPLEQNPGPSICLDTYLYVSIDAHNYLCSDSYTEDEFGYVTVYVTGSDPGFEVKIYDESSDIITSQSIMNNESVFISTLMAGTYLLIVKDENGGVFEQSFSIKIPENFEITYEIPITPTYCDEFVKPRLRIQGGTSPYNFKIFDPQGELIRSGSLSSEFWIGNVFIGVEREYTFEIIDKNECYEVITLFIENELETEVFRIEPEIKSPSGPTANDGSIVAHVTGGVKPYVYEWLNGNGEVIQDSIFQNLTPGSYLFRSTDANGCESSELIELNFVSSLNSLDSEIKIELSPNPCSDFLNIYTDINHYSQVINVTILNTNGQEMYTSQMYQAKSQIDVTDLTPGIYMAQFTMAGRSAIQKFVKL